MSSPAAAGALGLGGIGMNTGMTPIGTGVESSGAVEGSLNGSLGLHARDQDEERRRRIEEIVALLGRRWGRVSQEGVERCARRVGLEWMWEEEAGGKRTLSIAGSGVLVDVGFLGEEIEAVVLSFPASGEGVGKMAEKGARVLKRDLKSEGDGYVMLDAFTGNLERLAKMDQLGGGVVSCFDAVEGVYGCLKQVFEWEVEKSRQGKGGGYSEEAALRREVMCKGSGRPQMHVGGRVGFALQYWQERRLVPGRKRKAEEMDIVGRPEDDELDEHPDSKIYSAVIECEALPSQLYPPIRVSHQWVSAQIEKPPLLNPNPFSLLTDSPIDWLEPPPTLLASSPSALPNGIALDHNPLLPPKSLDIRFIAHFEPPVIVSLQAALDIYESVGEPIAQESIQATTYESLLFADVDQTSSSPIPSPSQQTPRNPLEERSLVKIITSYPPAGPPLQKKHRCTLFNPQQAYARTITHIPFSHPRQLVAILPILRQWALLGAILRRCFAPPFANATSPSSNSHFNSTISDLSSSGDNDNDQSEGLSQTSTPTAFSTLDEELDALLSPTPPPSELHPPLAIDISLSLNPSPPRLGILCELPTGRLRNLSFTIGLNGAVGLLEDGEVDVAEEEKRETERARRVLEIGECVGILAAWMGGAGREEEGL